MHIQRIGNFCATLLLFLASTIASAKEIVRIDASSSASAQASWDRMLSEAPPEQQRKLIGAVLQLNLVGVNSASEVVSNPDLQNLSVVRVKDKIAGL